ncbi:GSCFA domain-containing protein [Flavobacterium gawalongense]|uniref:GSCFA domain-containing protein n=1 Tax=Flavobacterium gawalongense TaxID=2594432 RepID=A0A553BJ93_9FLAO|nr:GSCFA domain-containing protein [Flavobacterium gawalongense]TRX03960.1 GSCFA domain-containing protein [Flavobacterium gawalongense]TRX07137.1 GSCFA domain-containing protein [Flavobacterium gawalongense]TRX08317.1 GSCFA domain-containing protein [Flavobacterium gawalongense]TRX09002.1 GSCFA domain-containing protein [Flavobacterium gawalongense]TRX25306.1 GSCFA domain-containing protein [Flavobacterium gawalongense]
MNFRTQIPIPKSNHPLDYSSIVVSLGSCFAENISDKFQYFKFQNTINPFGIIFNPVSIDKIIHKAINAILFTENDIFFHNERWHCFDVHSDLSISNKDELIESLNAILKSTKQQLQEASHVIITYGTSWVYRNIESGNIVANCHKVPQKQFKKELLSAEENRESIANTLNLIHSVNPNCNVIFTVSPIRHIKDGFVENQWSKANLISAIHSVPNFEYCKLNTEYFPSYEIMMDELRDYRFYAEDMLHPNQVAIDYIWKRFKETTISETAFSIMEEVEGIQKSLSHKPFNPDSESHLKFETKLREKITKLVSRYSFIKF